MLYESVFRLFLILLLLLTVACTEKAVEGKEASYYFSDVEILRLIELLSEDKDISVLLNQGIDFNFRGKEGMTPLFWCFMINDKRGVAKLLKSGADPKISGYRDRNVVHTSVINGNYKMLKVLLLHGSDINAIAKNGRTPLMEAIISRNPKMIDFLFENGANVNALSRGSSTAMMTAANIGAYKIVYQLLVERGGDHSIVSSNGITLAHKLNSPVGDASKWKAKVKAVLEQRGVTFPVKMPPAKIMPYQNRYKECVEKSSKSPEENVRYCVFE